GDTGYTEIVDSNGIIIARTEPGKPPEAFETSDHPGRFAELIREGKATVRTCHRCHGPADQPERRKDVLAFAPLSTASWGIAIRQSEEEALAPTRELQMRLLILGAILLGSASLMMWILVQGLVRPIKILTAASERVASGDFEATIPIKRRDEIGQLGSAFNSMTRELARQRDELVSRTEDLATLNSISTMVSQSLELEQVLANALQKVLEITRTQAGCVFLLGPTGNSLEMKSRINLPSVFDCKESGSPETPCACHQALRWGQTQLVDDVSQCPVLDEDAVAKNRINCFVSIPLKSTRRVLGVMNVASTGDRYFTESDFKLLDSIGYHVALAIDNSILYEEARQKEELRGQLLDSVISAQEEERKRIARELHDEYGQTLTGLIWSIESVENLASAEQPQLKEKLKNVKSIASRGLEVMRRLTFDLRPLALDDLGLIAAIRAYAETQLAESGTSLDFKNEGLGKRLASSSVEIALFRIVQEAIRNIARHAEAQNVKIRLKASDSEVTAVIEDDGKGFDVSAVFRATSKTRSLGLLGIRERVALLSGSFDVSSEAGKGTRITVEIPLDSLAGTIPPGHSPIDEGEPKPN
ncbi:MAG: GAF domain-containing protein, partial [Dehalococcoidia bacterium]